MVRLGLPCDVLHLVTGSQIFVQLAVIDLTAGNGMLANGHQHQDFAVDHFSPTIMIKEIKTDQLSILWISFIVNFCQPLQVDSAVRANQP